jgi:UDP-N-acetylglucosamine--N-acetylmuramyl-(pentapeptide) pyrophosphoryl-undecaprenol N-acetylglucosamine transferase
LTLGGSQGSHAINVAMVAAAPELARRCPHLEIVHQTGARDQDWVRGQYDAAGIQARVVAFLDAVAREMKEADVVVSRAGATTLAELAALARPAVLIPLPTATDDHQRKNAQALAERGAARLVDQAALAGDSQPLVEAVAALLESPSARADMSAAMHRFARPDAAARIVSRLLELAA